MGEFIVWGFGVLGGAIMLSALIHKRRSQLTESLRNHVEKNLRRHDGTKLVDANSAGAAKPGNGS